MIDMSLERRVHVNMGIDMEDFGVVYVGGRQVQ